MNRFLTLVTMLLLMVSATVQAQQPCGFDVMHQKMLSQNPEYAQRVQQFDQAWSLNQLLQNNALIKNTPAGTIYEIPVVVHVVHTGGAVGSQYNPTDASIQSWIDYLNAAYAATWPAYPSATNGGVNIPLRFVLAKRDPNCSATNGIVRVNGSSVPNYTQFGVNVQNTNGADEVDIKNLSRWSNRDYYNIWLVHKIDGVDGTTGGILGFAYFPGAAANIDGTLMLTLRAVPGESTAPHELGHAMNLYHTFQGGSATTCPPNTNCNTQGDFVCDTDPHMQGFNCPSGTNPCTGTGYNNVQHNIMSYYNCEDRFTAGQSTRVVAAITGPRASLLSSLAVLPPGPGPANTCVPTIANANNGFNYGPRNVTFANLTSISGGYTVDGNVHYRDRTCAAGTYVDLGATYNISITTGSGVSRVRVYIDYNNDGTLDPVSELVYSNNGTTTTQTHTGTVTIPNTATTCVPLRMRVVADASSNTNIGPCSQLTYGQAEDFTVIARSAPVSNPSLNVALTNGFNPSCLGESLTFTATPSANIAGAIIHWYRNGVFTGQSGSTYTNNNFTNNEAITAYAIYNNGCELDSVLSNSFTVQRLSVIAATVSLALTSGDNPGCAGQTYVFTATISNGGPTPVITWKVNGTAVQTGGLTYTTSTLNNSDIVTVEVIGSGGCPDPSPAISNAITIVQTIMVPNVALAITSGSNPMCQGANVTFQATPTNGGANPQYVWTVNGTNVGTGNTFSSTTLNNNDVVKVLMYSSLLCANPTSDTASIVMTVIPNLTPAISISVIEGLNPGCIDSPLTFEAAVSNAGTTPNITWLVNGTPAGTSSPITFTSLVNGDVVTATVAPTAGGCYTTTLATSNSVPIVKSAPGTTPIISFIGNTLVSSTPPPMEWYGPNGLIAGVSGNTYVPTMPGFYYARYLGTTCPSAPSNKLNVVINLSIGSFDFSQVSISPNPASTHLTIDWKGKTSTAQVSLFNNLGQKLISENSIDQSKTTLDVTNLPAGTYFLVIKDAKGKTGTTQVSVVR